jgi:hypothetical protein
MNSALHLALTLGSLILVVRSFKVSLQNGIKLNQGGDQTTAQDSQ